MGLRRHAQLPFRHCLFSGGGGGPALRPDSAIFALAFIMAIIVMYDAMGVRRETGEQAKILNRMLTDWMEAESANSPFLGDKKLKEMVGHTPFEVLGGAIVGVAVGWLIPII